MNTKENRTYTNSTSKYQVVGNCETLIAEYNSYQEASDQLDEIADKYLCKKFSVIEIANPEEAIAGNYTSVETPERELTDKEMDMLFNPQNYN